LCGDEFYTTLTGLIGHLRRQQNLIAEMSSTCPIVASTRWLSLGKVCKWLTRNRVRVLEHLENKSPTCSPAEYWWIVLLAVNEFMEPVDVCFRKMQGLSTLLGEQKEALRRLVHALKGIVCVEGPFTTIEIEHEKSIMAASDNSISRNDPVSVGQYYVVRRAAVSEFISDLGIFCENMYRSLSDENNRSLEQAIGLLFVAAVEEIQKIQAERSNYGE
jgi:hypothetical protein